MNDTPKQLGFMMPAEWELHSAVWLAWPYDTETFPNRVTNVEQKYVEIISALAGSEKVELLVKNEEVKKRVEKMLGDKMTGVNFHIVSYADVWIRDYGPIFLSQKKGQKEKLTAFVKSKYNGYGKAYDPYYAVLLKDDEVFNKLDLNVKKINLDMVLEGGSIEVDGQGNLITTEQCLLNPNRNPNLSKEQIEENLKEYLGVENIVWLKFGLTNDHTDGHVDDIVKFVGPKKVLACFEDDSKDANYEILKTNYEILEKQSFEIIKLPMPHMQYEDGTKAPVSYANFYIGNKVVLVPTYADKNDQLALSIIQSCFPERKVVGIDCRNIIYGGGAIHCITQQQPI